MATADHTTILVMATADHTTILVMATADHTTTLVMATADHTTILVMATADHTTPHATPLQQPKPTLSNPTNTYHSITKSLDHRTVPLTFVLPIQ
jgi:hypothetical protein